VTTVTTGLARLATTLILNRLEKDFDLAEEAWWSTLRFLVDAAVQ